jgi:TetR/AcrR family transcriptional regulator, mexJK operon transcriptional repressor
MTELSPRAKAKRDQIRTAAQKMFLENGFAASSMDAIASEAGVSKQTLYSYYPGKDDLLTDVLRQLIQNFSHDLFIGSLAPQNRSELQKVLVHLAQTIVASLMQPNYLALVRIIIAETPRFPHLGSLFRSTVPEQILNCVCDLLEQSRQQGIVRFGENYAAARMFVGPVLTFILLDGLFIGDRLPEQPSSNQIEEIVDLYMKAIIVV